MLPLEKITVNAIARATMYGVSSNNNVQLGVTCEVVDHEQHNGSLITAILVFADNTSERALESLNHFGWEGDELAELANLDEAACAKLLPNVVQLVCEPETYNGKKQLKVQWINRPGAGRFTFKQSLEGGDLRAFSSQMKNMVKAVRAAGGAHGKSAEPQGQRPQPQTQRRQGGGAHPNAPGGAYPDEGPPPDDRW
jgi:hypothetical protein